MTAKDKAIELVEKFKIDNYDWIAQGSNVTAKKYAIIAINEMLDFRNKFYINNPSYQYLLDVKTEIEKL